MIRLACDSDSLESIQHTPFIFTYADLIRDRGALSALRARFPGSLVKLIDRGLGDPAGVASAIRAVDDESGALDNERAARAMLEWVKEGRQYVTGYANRSTMPGLRTAARQIGLADHEWWRWYATLDGTMRVDEDPGAMVQFANADMAGVHVDFSIVWNEHYHPGVA